MKTKKKSINIVAIWSKVFSLLKQYPVIVAPFLYIAVFDIIMLTILFLVPRQPFSVVLAPIIKSFWGERFLHYPANFLLLPKLLTYARNGAGFIIGVFFTGIAVSLINQANRKINPNWLLGLHKTVKRYFRLVILWGITVGVLFIIIKITGYLRNVYIVILPILHSRKLIFGIEFMLSMIVQMLFVFAIPAVIVENRKIFSALVRSFALFKNHAVTVFLLVFIPGLLLIPISYLQAKIPFFIENIFPEAVLYVLVIRIGAVTFIDIIITASATVLLLMNRAKERQGTSL